MTHFDPPLTTGETALVYVAPCNVGRGLFASRDIAAGTEILRLSGPVLTLSEVRAKGPHAANAMQVGIDRYLDLEEPGRFANHACEPNAGIMDDTKLVALRDLQADEEIRFDYSTTISDGWTMTCLCGAASCRGVVAAFQLLPAQLRQRYAILEIVQRFIVEEIEA